MPEIAAGSIIDGNKTIPIDEANADYREFLVESGKTHAEVLAEAKVLSDAAEVVAQTQRNTRRSRLRTTRQKFLDLGFTRAEIREFFPDPDPE